MAVKDIFVWTLRARHIVVIVKLCLLNILTYLLAYIATLKPNKVVKRVILMSFVTSKNSAAYQLTDI